MMASGEGSTFLNLGTTSWLQIEHFRAQARGEFASWLD